MMESYFITNVCLLLYPTYKTEYLEAYLTKEVNPGLAKPSLNLNGCLAKHGLNSLVK